jgi:hypothetical protein
MTAWATTDDVLDVTGREATEESVALARTMIALVSGTTESASDNDLIAGRNLELLRQAVCFQAVWLDSHPDVLDTMDTTGVSQDGLNAQYSAFSSHLYAPLAMMCIRRLSWRKAALRPRRAGYGGQPNRGNRDSAVADDGYHWTPL